MSKKVQEKAKQGFKVTPNTKIDMVFGKQNYMLAALAFGVVLIGFLLMYGTPEQVYDFRQTTLAPIVVILGFLIGVIAIMYKPKAKHGAD